MKDCISRESAIEICDWYEHEYSEAEAYIRPIAEDIKKLPSADVVEVVRCKDCKDCDTGIDEEGNHFMKCLGWVYGGTNENDYCSHGVRVEMEIVKHIMEEAKKACAECQEFDCYGCVYREYRNG